MSRIVTLSALRNFIRKNSSLSGELPLKVLVARTQDLNERAVEGREPISFDSVDSVQAVREVGLVIDDTKGPNGTPETIFFVIESVGRAALRKPLIPLQLKAVMEDQGRVAIIVEVSLEQLFEAGITGLNSLVESKICPQAKFRDTVCKAVGAVPKVDFGKLGYIHMYVETVVVGFEESV